MDTKEGRRLTDFKSRLFADITEVPQVLQQSHFPGLDGLRGISILVVVACHFAIYTPFMEYLTGDIGVEIFFVISGFLITSLLLKEKVKRSYVSFKNFYIRRILRIVPVAYLFLITIVLLNHRLGLNVTPMGFVTGFLYIRNIPLKYLSDWCTGHFWSLSVEEQFYILFPFFIVTQTNRFIAVAVFLIILFPILNLLVFNNVGVFYSNHTLHLATVFIVTLFGRGTASILVGSLCAVLMFKKIIIVERLKSHYLLPVVLFIFAFLLLTQPTVFYVHNLSEFVFPFIISYIILLNLKGQNLLRQFLSTRVMVATGILSYSIYIWQQLFTTSDTWHLLPILDMIPVRIILLFLVSWLSYNYFEKFFLRYKRHFQEV
jgi:peptidoglycan/LPS O-acetylase OafA/YrhL